MKGGGGVRGIMGSGVEEEMTRMIFIPLDANSIPQPAAKVYCNTKFHILLATLSFIVHDTRICEHLHFYSPAYLLFTIGVRMVVVLQFSHLGVSNQHYFTGDLFSEWEEYCVELKCK